MQRALSLYLPTWSVDLIRRRTLRQRHHAEPRDPPPAVILLVSTRGHRQWVVRLCEHAAAAGVRSGMTLAHARALLPAETQAHPFEPQREEEVLRALAHWAMRFSPLVAPDPPDGLLMDITGCQRLFRGERRLVHQIADTVDRLGFKVRLASAPSFGCAWAAARFGRQDRRLIHDLEVREVLCPLPTAALRIGEQTQASLGEVGIECIGDLLQLPRGALPSRFSEQLLLRLDQAMGRVPEMIACVRRAPPLQVERLFTGPVKQPEAVGQTVHALLTTLASKLQRLEAGARCVNVSLMRFYADPVHLTVTLSRPSRDVKHLWALLRPQVEQASLGHGVERIRLTAPRVGALAHKQANLQKTKESPDQNGDSDLGQLIDVMTGRLGSERVVRIESTETHIPERVYHRHSATTPPTWSAPAARVANEDRPSVLFDPPQPIQVIATTPDGPPSWLCWHHQEHRVVTSTGPYRIANEWWKEGQKTPQDRGDSAVVPLSARDYFKIADDRGRWLWVFRDHTTGHWFVHGQWA